jgi:putative membrane protein
MLTKKTFIVTSLAALTDTQASAERVLTTPLPIGYNILISQIVLLYVYLLPFQLWQSLHWVTIPGTIAAAYIIVGLAAIGNELENPFGNDVNDLPLDSYCMELAKELDTLTSVPAPKFSQVLKGGKEGGMGGVLSDENRVLWPLSSSGYGEWVNRSEGDIRSALKAKVVVGKGRTHASGSETPSDGSLRMSA